MKKFLYFSFSAMIMGSIPACGSQNFEPNPYVEAKLDSIDKVYRENYINDTSKQLREKWY
nr:hypothetical protein [Bacteroidia bacterium]